MLEIKENKFTSPLSSDAEFKLSIINLKFKYTFRGYAYFLVSTIHCVSPVKTLAESPFEVPSSLYFLKSSFLTKHTLGSKEI